MNFVSLKENVCRSIVSILNFPTLKGNKAFFLTSAGLISGNVISMEENQDLQSRFKLVHNEFYRKTIENFEENLQQKTDNVRVPHDACILLNDVEILPFGQSNPVKLEAFILFVDSVIGVFAGNMLSVEQNEN